MALAGKETEKTKNEVLAPLGERPRGKYEAGPRASQKNGGVFWLSENPIGACLAPMVVLAH
jgi:hypothetical protein